MGILILKFSSCDHMENLISDLQKDLINGVDDLQILRKALILSKQLNLDEFTNLINNELNGYDESDDLPDYRILECTLMGDTDFKRYIPTEVEGLPEESYDLLHTIYLYESIPEIIDLTNSGYPFIMKTLDYRIQKPILESNSDLVRIYRACPMHKLKSVISNVKNIILEWSIELNNENSCSNDDIIKRNDSHVLINHVDNLNIMGDNAQITNIFASKEEIQDNLNDMQNIINSQNIDDDAKINIQNNILVIKKELEKEKPDLSKMQSASNLIKSFIKDISISATANLLTQHIDVIINLISSML